MAETSLLQSSLPEPRDAARCIACGTCLQACPVYAAEAHEELAPRGRNTRIFELLKNLDRPEEIKNISKCLLCGRCTMVCPRGIHNDRIVAYLRSKSIERTGLPLMKKVVFRKMLLNRKHMGRALRAAAKLQFLMPEAKIVEAGPVRLTPAPAPVRHLPLFLSGLAGGRTLPSVAPSFLSEQLPVNTPPAGSAGHIRKVAYFSGCSAEFILPQTGLATVRLFSQAGFEVVFPKEQGCCGLAAHANGDVETAMKMAVHNCNVLEETGADAVVTGCATCGSALKTLWPRLSRNPEEQARLKALADKVLDVSELVLEACDPGKFSCVSALPAGASVTWHEPCHLARHQNVSREPLTLLRRTFGTDFRELSKPGCCGFGGSFSLCNYPMSKTIAQEKAKYLKKSGADYVVTSCPGCMIQLMDLMIRHEIPGRVLHLAEALTFKA